MLPARHCLFIAVVFVGNASLTLADQPVDVGSRLELFVDDHLISKTEGDVVQHLVRPKPEEVVFETGESWEGNTSGYYTFFRDGDLYRMIYRGWQHDEQKKAEHKEITCYAESKDGRTWVKPKLGLFEWEGSKDNNIVWMEIGTHNFTAFRDDNPATSKEARFKAFGGGRGGLIAFQSPDCIHWKVIRDKPVITHGAFDSQNLAFWDTDRREYRAYWRFFTKGTTSQKVWKPGGFRAIRTATSKDFIKWESEADLTYPKGTPDEHLYTNAIQKYFRAPHLFLGFPTRYESKSQQVEPIFMASRDGVHFKRYKDAVVPRTAPKDRNHNRSNYMTWGMFQLPGKSKEIAVYATENYYERTPGRIRRFTYRVDGFVALRSGTNGGSVLTKPLKYKGQQLRLNYVVNNGGQLTVKLYDAKGQQIGQSKPITGDAVDAVVDWQQAPKLSNGTVQLRFELSNADLYSMRFQ
ncbi:MAG: hypothetical protein CMJ78_04475 [Planctomycetaceae bacterium]|nr:hypothetical protein [Planctomycetaceae bacterium]